MSPLIPRFGKTSSQHKLGANGLSKSARKSHTIEEMAETFWIALFGMCGVLARYGLDLGVARLYVGSLPLATLLVNVIGSFLIGWLSARYADGSYTRPIAIGLLGGFTTFSAYSIQVVHLGLNGNWVMAGLYGLLTPVLGVVVAGWAFWVFNG